MTLEEVSSVDSGMLVMLLEHGNLKRAKTKIFCITKVLAKKIDPNKNNTKKFIFKKKNNNTKNAQM